MASVAVEAQQRMIHVLAVVAVIADAFPRAMRRVVGAIEVQHDPARRPGAPPLADIQLDQHGGELFDRVPIDRILQPGQGWLAGEGRAAERPAATHQLEQRIGAQGSGIVLVGVAAGDLVEPLPHQGFEAVVHGPAAPVGEAGRERRAQAQGRIRFR